MLFGVCVCGGGGDICGVIFHSKELFTKTFESFFDKCVDEDDLRIYGMLVGWGCTCCSTIDQDT